MVCKKEHKENLGITNHNGFTCSFLHAYELDRFKFLNNNSQKRVADDEDSTAFK